MKNPNINARRLGEAFKRRSELQAKGAEAEEIIKKEIDENGYSVIGPQGWVRFGLTQNSMTLVTARLVVEGGYKKHYLRMEEGVNHPLLKVLTKKDVTYGQLWPNRGEILKSWQETQNQSS